MLAEYKTAQKSVYKKIIYLATGIILGFLFLNMFSVEHYKNFSLTYYLTGVRKSGGMEILYCVLGGGNIIDGFLLNENVSNYQSVGVDMGGNLDTTAPVYCMSYPVEIRNHDLIVKKVKMNKKSENILTFIGNSITFGVGVPSEEAFPELIDHEIEGRERADEWRVFNFGVPGADFPQIYDDIFKEALNAGSDTIIYVWSITDILKLGPVKGDQEIALIDREDPLYISRGPRLLKSIWTTYLLRRQIKIASQMFHDCYSEKNEPAVLEFKKYLRRMNEESTARGVQFGVVLFPLLLSGARNFEFAEEHKAAADILRAEKIPFIDLKDAVLTGDGFRELWVHTNDQRPNRKAHQKAARAIFPFLEKNFIDTQKTLDK